MEDIKEVRFSDAELILKDNRVRSAILPQSAKELSRNIKISGNTTIEGAVFGNHINIDGGNTVIEGALYAGNELHVSSDIADPVIFRKAVASADTIAAFATSSNVIFGSDLNAKKVRLKNCFVGGSVFAEEAYLENCVVLGGVFATKQLTISSTMFGTLHSPYVEMSGINYMLYPACFTVEPMSALPNTKLYNLSLADLGALFKGEPEKEYTGKIFMDIENDMQRMILMGDHDETIVVNSYSVSGRVLAADMIDFDKMQNHFLIEAGALGTQILKVYSLTKQDGSKSEPLTVENISTFMFDVLKGKITPQDVSGEIDFSEFKKNFS